jgi:hypothetical protein
VASFLWYLVFELDFILVLQDCVVVTFSLLSAKISFQFELYLKADSAVL